VFLGVAYLPRRTSHLLLKFRATLPWDEPKLNFLDGIIIDLQYGYKSEIIRVHAMEVDVGVEV
jgi:hypothetical protein